MRDQIDHLDSEAVAWTSGAPGIFSRMLNENNMTGERTALVVLDPTSGMQAPGTSHYHSVYEELFVLDGRFTFDSKTWLTRHSYCFHPAYMVHGFASQVPERTVLLARSPRELDFNMVGLPARDQAFTFDGSVPTRPAVYLAAPDQKGRWQPLVDAQGREYGAQVVLSRDETSGEQSRLVRYFPGWQCDAHQTAADLCDEGFVLEGAITGANGQTWASGHYWHRAPGTDLPALTSPHGVLFFSATES